MNSYRKGKKMQTKIYKNDILGEEFSLSVLENGLKIYLLEKKNYKLRKFELEEY